MDYKDYKEKSQPGNSTVYLMDCMEALRQTPDNYYSLSIVDPPYGIGISSNPVRQQHQKKDWDSAIPTKEYFNELFRVSKNQIIWGGNYFDLPPTQGFYIWDKKQPHDFSLAMCEMAWSSLQKPAKMWSLSVLKEKNKIHPTQKPVQLYEWLLMNNAQEGDKILDTHAGSMSSVIACLKNGYNITAFEIDKEYFEKGKKRVEDFTSQLRLFVP